MKRYLKLGYKVYPVYLVEPIEIVANRVLGRGGKISNIEQRHKRIKSIIKEFPGFVGTTSQVREHLVSIVV